MLSKIIFKACLCLLALTIAYSWSCKTATPVYAEESEKTDNDASEIIICLGDKKLTMQQVKWADPEVVPSIDRQRIADFANWWLENELLYAEAQRRGVTNEPGAKFVAEMMRKRAFAQELKSRVRDSVKISDEESLAYYEKNKETDPRLKVPGFLSFSHIRTKTLKEAEAVLERIKAGEDVNALAKELSTHVDAKTGGVVRSLVYNTVKRSFGARFFGALLAAKEGELIGPIKLQGDLGHEVARHKGKIEPGIRPFKEVKGRIVTQLLQPRRREAADELIKSLKEKAADKIVKGPRIAQTGGEAGKNRNKTRATQGK